MEADVSVLFSEQPATGPYPKPGESSPQPHAILETHFSVILPFTRVFCYWFCDWNFIRTSHLPYSCFM